MVKHSDGTFGSDADTFAGVAATGFLDLSNAALSGPSPNDKAAPPDAPVQIVFIEANVPDAQDLANGVKAGVQVVLLDPSQDGVTQIADYLTSHHIQNLAAIDIVAHGADGALQLGSATLSSANITDYQAQLAAIGAALSPGGAIQIYGCDVGEDAAGVSFLEQLSQATGGANIAAASHLVGDAAGGGSFNLNVNVGTIDVAAPFTAAALTSYQGELAASTAQLYFTSAAGDSTSSGATQVGVSGSIAGTQIRLAVGSASNETLFAPDGIAFDAPLGKYFISNENNTGNLEVADILEGNIGVANGTPTEIYHFGASSNTAIEQIAIDQPDGKLFFTQVNLASSNPYTVNTTETGIFEIPVTNSDGTTATQVIKDVSGGVTLVGPTSLSLDVPDNLIFFMDSDGPEAVAGGINRLVVGNMTTGNFTVLHNFPSSVSSASGSAQQNDGTSPSIAIDTATQTIYITQVNGAAGNTAQNFILSAQYTVTGSGSSASATIGAFTTLYSGAGADYPLSITLDPADGIFYTTGYAGTPGNLTPEIFQGSLSHTGAGSLTPVTNIGALGAYDQLSFESIPTITASGGVTYIAGGSPVVLDSGAVVTNEDGQNLASATVVISGGTFTGDGDTLVATAVGSITASYTAATETLTLTGNDTVAQYEQELASITFSSTSANPTNSGNDLTRTISWSGTDGVINSGTVTSTVNIQVAPTVNAGGTVTFNGGGSPVPLDPGLTITDLSGANLTGATISIHTGFITVDRLNFTNQNGISEQSFNSGTLVLTGVASATQYATALDSITYSVSPSNSDPTGGGGNTTRTIDWSVNGAVVNSGTVTSTLDTVHTKPTVTAGGTVTFDGGGSPVALDPGLAVTDVDNAGVLSSATVTVASAITGDTLNFTNSHPSTEGNIAVASDSNGVLVLTSAGTTATVLQWETALESVTYSFSPSNGDPTNGGGDTSRTIDWVVNDGNTSNGVSSTSTSTLDTVHVAPTLAVTGASIIYPEHGAAVPLASSVTVTDPDSLGNLGSATVSISGPINTDSLNFTNQNGITGSYDVAQGKLTLTGTASIANYEAALQSVTYSSSGDPTDGGNEPNRTIAWQVNDGAANSGVEDTSLATLCFCAGTQIATPTGEVPVEQLAVGDLVLTLDGRLVPIDWIGTGQSLLPHGARSPATPVIVRAGALGDDVPRQDLRITKGHSLYLEGVLIPVENLINHRTILWDDAARSVVVYHIELATHEILLANGAPAESYRDDGNRVQFQNVNPDWDLAPVLEPFAPIVTNGKLVEALWQRLALRAEPDMPIALTEDPDLHLRVDGMRVAPSMARHGIHAFEIMPGATDVQIASRSAIPSELGLNGDHRRLGVAVQRIVLRQQGLKLEIDAESLTLEAGFQLYEPGGGFRWTDGAGVLPPSALAVFAPGHPISVEVYVAHTARYRAPEQQTKLAEAA